MILRFTTPLKQWDQVLMRRCYSKPACDMNLTEARKLWYRYPVSEMIRLLKWRNPPAIQHGHVHVKTCRILCTDRHIPYGQVETQPARNFSMSISSEELSKLKRYRSPMMIDKITGDYVDIYWSPIAEERQNAITVSDVQNQCLTTQQRELYGTDLLRLHLTLTGHGLHKDIYFCDTEFVETLHIHSDWMDLLTELIQTLNDRAPYVGDDVEHSYDHIISEKHAVMKRDLVRYMKRFKYPVKMQYHLPKYLAEFKKGIMKFDCMSSETLRILRELCVITNVYTPYTAQRNWDALHSKQHELETNKLEDQLWTQPDKERVLPVLLYVIYSDSEGKSVFRDKVYIQSADPDSLTCEQVTHFCVGSKKFHRKFASKLPNLEIESVKWSVPPTLGSGIRVVVIVKSTPELHEIVRIRNSL